MLREWVFVGWVKTFSGSITQMILKQLDARKDNLGSSRHGAVVNESD